MTDAAGNKIQTHAPRQVFINFDEDSLQERMERVKGFESVNQVERCYMVTKGGLDLHDRKRLRFEGRNRGNSLFPVKAPSWSADDLWKLQVKTKREVLGKKGGVILVGGAGPESAEIKKEAKRAPTDVEPVFYHSLPIAVDEEWCHSFNCAAMVSCNAGAGHDAYVCVLNRKPFFGVTLTDEHTHHLKIHLEKMVWKAMLTDKSKLHCVELAALMKELGDDNDAADDADGADGEGKKSKAKAKAKAEAKAEAKDGAAAGKGKKNKTGQDGGGGNPGGQPKKKAKKDDSQMTKEELLAQIAALSQAEDPGEAEDSASEGQ